jgi:superfamily II DNA or RNA helicase
MFENTIEIEKKTKTEPKNMPIKDDIDAIFERIDNAPASSIVPTGGKTVYFLKLFVAIYQMIKVVVLTHRIELCKQTSKKC